MYIGVDFDGTICKHEYPAIGEPVPGALEKLRELQKTHKLILFTMRSDSPQSGPKLTEAVEFLRNAGITLYGINENPTQYRWTRSPKAYCHIYIDDAAYGCPLIYPKNGERPYVDWSKINI